MFHVNYSMGSPVLTSIVQYNIQVHHIALITQPTPFTDMIHATTSSSTTVSFPCSYFRRGLLTHRTEGSSEYTTCAGLLTASSSVWPNTAVFQLAANGVALNKIVIGKPATAADATNGFVSTSTLASCLATAKGQGWSGVRPSLHLYIGGGRVADGHARA